MLKECYISDIWGCRWTLASVTGVPTTCPACIESQALTQIFPQLTNANITASQEKASSQRHSRACVPGLQHFNNNVSLGGG